jgi:transposase
LKHTEGSAVKAGESEIRRKRRVLEHAIESGNVAKTCRYFGVPRASFYRWRNAYQEYGEEGLQCKKSIAKSHPNQTPDEIVEKILHLRQKYRLGPVRIMWYMARYHQMRVSDATIYRVLKRTVSIAYLARWGVEKCIRNATTSGCPATTSKWMLNF